MADRKQQLEKMLEREPNDPFLLYGLALEHKKANELEPALQLLKRVIGIDPGYCYAYFQGGQILAGLGDVQAARNTLELGIAAARQKGDAHAESELSGALAELSE